MSAVVMLARSELRRRWRSVVVLTLLVGFSGAVVLALVAGARRTESSLARFEQASRSADVEFDAGPVTPAQVDELRRTPGVAAVAQLEQLTLISRTGPFQNQFLPAAQIDRRFGTEVDRARIIEGRATNLDAVDELTISESLADVLHVGVGDHLSFASFSPADIERADDAVTATGPHVTFRVVGIVRRPLDLGGRGASGGVIVPTPAFLERYRDKIGSFSGAVLRVRTDHGSADVARVTSAARRIFRSPTFGVTSLNIEGQGAQNAIDVTTVGLYVAAGIAALSALVGIGIALSREISFSDADQMTLSALGLRPRNRTLAAAAIGLPVALVGAVLAVVGAVLASPIFPIGVAAKAEPETGIRFDASTIALGFAAIVLVVSVVALVAGLRTVRATRASAEVARPGIAARAMADWSAPPPVAVGVRFALDRGRQRHALPVRSSLVGAAFGVLVVVSVLVFSSGLHRLVTTPARYGWTWDLVGYDIKANPPSGRDCGPMHSRLTADRTFAAVASVCSAGVDVEGHSVTATGFQQLRGSVQPEVVAGRAPRGPHEVALGGDTLDAVHRGVGDTVRITAGKAPAKFTIVGQAVLSGISDPAPIADGAVFTSAALDHLGANGGGWNLVVTLAAGADRDAAIRAQRQAAVLGGPILPVLPAEIDRVHQIRGLPVTVAAFVAVITLVAVGLALVSSLRRRRRELAVLKTLGFSRRQIRATVAWQASTVAAVGLVVGVPLGLLVGTYVWRRVAEELGVASDPKWPVAGIALLAVGAFLAVNLIAAFPARRGCPYPTCRRPTIGVTVASRLDDIQPLDLASIRDDAPERAPWSSRATGSIVLAVVSIVIVVVAALVGDRVPLGPGRPLAIVLVAAWALAAVFVAVHRPSEPLTEIMALAAFVGALALFGAALAGRDVATATVRDFGSGVRGASIALFPAVALHLVLGVPTGSLVTRARRLWVLAGYVASAVLAVVMVGDRPEIAVAPLVAIAAADAVVGFVGYVARYRAATSVQERARLQWPAWGVVVAAAISAGAWMLHELLSWPDDLRAVVLATTVLVPLSLALGSSERLSVRIDRLLVHSITMAGLAAMVGASYLLIVLGLGRAPTGDEKTLLGLSMLAALIAALLWLPVRERLTEFATRRVYGERHAPDEVIRTFGSRLTRALPLDELLLQLAESLKKTMSLSVAEVWTRGAGGRLERSVSVPDRGGATLALGADEEAVVARAGVSGVAWASIWLPQVISADEEVLRVAPITNSGELLGMIIVRRPHGALLFDENDDQALTELARQVGLALHNVKLDSALQESLDEVQRQADELRASRARIVEAGDAQRRRIERDLHDGAEQHLVALAVSVNLVRQISDSDPDGAKVMLEQIGKDLQEAVQELRNLADGIYPPLLMDRGLAEALSAAAGRAALPTGVEADGIGRYPQLVEAAVYFCCLEALQNAAKHAGDGAQAMVKVWQDEGALLFEVRDDGAGFDLASHAQDGHGFVNMGDRVGAIGGTIAVESAPGQGTAIRGRIPLADQPVD